MPKSIFWFRRDLRLDDNIGLTKALQQGLEVEPIFIFDSNITDELNQKDSRIKFIHSRLTELQKDLREFGSGLTVYHGDPVEILPKICKQKKVSSLFFNRDYEPYARSRDSQINEILATIGISTHSFKDHVIFEKNEVVKPDGLPYTVFTPFKKKWLAQLPLKFSIETPNWENLIQHSSVIPSLRTLGFETSSIIVRPFNLTQLANYNEDRDFPSKDNTSYLSPHLRFGTISIRKIVEKARDISPTFLSELIWREFFIQILWHFPEVQNANFKSKYNGINWRNNEKEFELWCQGKTGYPMVDAGMRQLVQTGYMHNRVRMITAGFLCKHLLIHWQWGEAFFAKHLLDFELASNNGNWQWAAGTGCDAAPYFRVFNPTTQLQKFDPKLEYINKWIPEYNHGLYHFPMVDHKFARERAISTYKVGITN